MVFPVQKPRSQMPPESATVRVRPFEGRLLTILDALLLRVPAERGASLLHGAGSRPAGFSAACLKQTRRRLRRGLVGVLARAGFARQASLQNERRVRGRLWERHRPESLGLEFSPFVLELLINLACPADCSVGREGPQPRTFGDRVLCLVGWEFLRETPDAAGLRGVEPWGSDGLIRLTWPGDFGLESTSVADFRPWFEPERQWLLEAWQGRLVQAWRTGTASEATVSGRGGTVSPEGQTRLLDAYLKDAKAAGRQDLALWILKASVGAVSEGRESTGLAGALQTLRDWNAEMRRVGYLDEGYAASQLWKNEWERLKGDEIMLRIAGV